MLAVLPVPGTKTSQLADMGTGRGYWLVQGEVAMVAVAAEVWKAAPQKAAQAIDRLMALRLVSGTAIVNWVFDNRGVRQLDDELATGLAWEVFYNAVDKMLARAQVCTHSLATTYMRPCERAADIDAHESLRSCTQI